MAQTELHSINQDLTGFNAQLRDELQIIGMALYLINAELLSDQIGTRRFVRLGQSALDRVADMLDGRAPSGDKQSRQNCRIEVRAAKLEG